MLLVTESRGTRDSIDSHVLVRAPLQHAKVPANPPRLTDSGTYADDCLVQRVTVSKCYIVATVRPPSFPIRATPS